MANINERKEGHEEEERLLDSFLGSIVIGLIMLAFWFWVFFEYLGRL